MTTMMKCRKHTVDLLFLFFSYSRQQ